MPKIKYKDIKFKQATQDTIARADSYVAEFGNESWELDALEPAVLTDLVRTAVADYRDEERWQARLRSEQRARCQLKVVADEWEDIVRYVRPGVEACLEELTAQEAAAAAQTDDDATDAEETEEHEEHHDAD